MATKLNRSLKRETDVLQRFGKHRGRNFIIIIEPPHWVTIRVKGTREQYTMDVESIFREAMFRTMSKEYEGKVKEYKAKKKQGMKHIRKPVKPFFL